ncbi:MAG: hypothetical protein JRJ29_12085 [Deltaproteobacteria bacterium]|nr:hypothetical protein [Deltaproteobacteria bacterium]
MNQIVPRYEFRTFAQNFGIVETKMRKLSECKMIRESSEIYIVSSSNNENNTKIRDRKMDIKVLVDKKKGLEQWNPRMKGEFPMNTDIIKKEVFPAFSVEEPEFTRSEYSLDQYLDELIIPHPQLSAVRVFKRRFAFDVNGCIAEIAHLLVNGAAIQTVAVEHEDADRILEAMEQLDLTGYENVNYLLAIKRIIGMEPLPE